MLENEIVLRNNLNQENLIDYQRKKAQSRTVVKSWKKNVWRKHCSIIDSEIR